MVKISENLSTVIPKIMTKDVQVMYSAFGRETNGIKKLNFSETNTYKYLLGKSLMFIIIVVASLKL